MKDRPFSDSNIRPTEEALAKSLSKTSPLYVDLMNITRGLEKEWNYSKSSGWVLKVFDKKKALLYFIPLAKSFWISLTLREHEKEALTKDKELKSIKSSIISAKKYSEGYALRFHVTDEEIYQPVALLIKKIMSLR
jgi:hypothetical protein